MAVMVKTADLIAKFQYALDNNWGYIYGSLYETWTQAKQTSLVNSFIKQYGDNWKSSEAAKKNDKYYGAVYGAKWIGHIVTDCSGLFSWSFKQLGSTMYHGSNTMYSKWCTSKGKLNKGARTDGKELKPGTAVFTGTEGSHGHVGLYIGNGTVIEASGTQAGVTTTKITNNKWTYWGELIGVDYGNGASSASSGTSSTSTQKKEESKVENKKATVNAARVALRKEPTTSATILVRVDKGQQVEVLDNPEWTKVTYQGKTGYMMTKFLNI